MCELGGRYSHKKQDSVIAYKAVAKRTSDGTYHSLAMGFEYPKIGTWGNIPIVKEQVRIDFSFNKDVLISSYRKHMVGRSAAFLNLEDVTTLTTYCTLMVGYDIVVVKVELRKALMRGTYADHDIVAGRQMRIIKEVS